jgi:hypothetical protein
MSDGSTKYHDRQLDVGFSAPPASLSTRGVERDNEQLCRDPLREGLPTMRKESAPPRCSLQRDGRLN